jgi:hypothetical protein
MYEIWDFHSWENSYCILGYATAQFGKWPVIFFRYMLKMEIVVLRNVYANLQDYTMS